MTGAKITRPALFKAGDRDRVGRFPAAGSRLRPRVRLAAIGIAVALVALVARPASADKLCLGPEVGQAIGDRMRARAFDAALPPGWSVQGINVWSERIEVHLTAPKGRAPVVVELSDPDGGGAAPDGAGRSFSFFLRPAAAGTTDRERKALLAVASLVDEAVPEDAVKKPCQSTPSVSRPEGGPERAEDRAEDPRMARPWRALSTAVLELLVLALALARARRGERGTRGRPPSRFRPIERAALFVGAFAGLCPWSDPYLKVWLDTINDQRDVRACLALGQCTTFGEASSVDGFSHAVGWLDLRSLAFAGGLGLEGTLLLLHALTAAAILLVARLVGRAAGPSAGALAAVVCTASAFLSADFLVLYNCVALPGLGVVLLVAATDAVRRPGLAAIAVVALVAAILPNVHAAGAVAGISVVAVGLLAGRGRARLAALGAATFALGTFAIGPACWKENAEHLVARVRAVADGAPAAAVRAAPNPPGLWACVVILAVCVAGVVAGRRRQGAVATLATAAGAIAVPITGAMLAAGLVGAVTMAWKYIAYAGPAIAALAGIASADVVRVVPRRVALLLGALGMAAVPPILLSPGSRLLSMGGGAGATSTPLLAMFRFADLARLPELLPRTDWGYGRLFRNLKTPDDASVLAALEVIDPDRPLAGDTGAPIDAYLLRVPADRVPRPLPEGWVELRRHGADATLLVQTGTALEWGRFEACDSTASACAPSGLSIEGTEKPSCTYCLPGMPAPFEAKARRLELRIPLRPTPLDRPWAVVMPRGPGFCSGRVTGVIGRDASVSPDGTRADWVAPADHGEAGELRVAWDVNSPSCPHFAYSGRPPFFLEGDAETVGRLEALVRR